jgi:methyltransferase (TIGR00027 family)
VEGGRILRAIVLTSADTAYSIAHMRAEEGRRPLAERLFEDPYASLFADAGQHAMEGTRRFLELPNVVDSVRLRTRAYDDFVREGLAAGATQIVLLGAGFDARGLRLPEIPAHGARVYEVDFPQQLENKRTILAAGGIALPPWVAHVGCDLALPGFEDRLAADLERAGFRLGGGARVIMEGVAPYIDVPTFDKNLGFVARACGPGSTVGFEFVEGVDKVRADTRIRGLGFTRWEEVGFDTLWRRYLPGEPHPNAFFLKIGFATA